MEDLATAIRIARDTKTKVQFARDMGVTRQTVAAWERGECVPAHKQAVKLERLGIARRLFIDALLAVEATRGVA